MSSSQFGRHEGEPQSYMECKGMTHIHHRNADDSEILGASFPDIESWCYSSDRQQLQTVQP
jgi:inhibitor of KinA sporulation pathway (predicted exonuclease)